MKNFKIKFLLITALSIFLVLPVFSQNTSSRKQVEDPGMLKKLQGTWVFTEPGERTWFKVKISGNECKVWMSSPSTGHWNDGASNNDPTVCTITGCYRITDRNEYDGKLQSESLAFTIRNRTGSDGPTLNLHNKGGQIYLRFLDTYSSKILCKKVSPSYTPWD